jgi:hypothetical protein
VKALPIVLVKLETVWPEKGVPTVEAVSPVRLMLENVFVADKSSLPILLWLE